MSLATRTDPDAPREPLGPSPTSLPARLRASERFAKLWKYSVVSVVATVFSQVSLVALYGFRLLDARNAAVAATLIGAVPSYWLNRRWAWGRQDRSSWAREVGPYVVTTVVGLVFSTWATSFASGRLASSPMTQLDRTAALGGVYFASFGVLWVAKFLVNELIFSTAPREPAMALALSGDTPRRRA
jgi:putative flippase GtrA